MRALAAKVLNSVCDLRIAIILFIDIHNSVYGHLGFRPNLWIFIILFMDITNSFLNLLQITMDILY